MAFRLFRQRKRPKKRNNFKEFGYAEDNYFYGCGA